jgi:hypothetical protein
MAVDVHRDIVRELAAGVLDGAYIEEAPTDPGREDGYGQAVRQAAFQLWAYEAGKSIPVTRRMLKERTGLDVDASTMRRWRDQGEWAAAGGQLHQILRSETRDVTQKMLDIGMVKAMRWAVGIFDRDEVADSIKLRVWSSLLDRNGFPVLLRGEMTDSLSIPANSEYAGMSDAELEARIYEYAGDVEGAVLPEPQTDDRFEVMQNIERARSLSAESRSRSR